MPGPPSTGTALLAAALAATACAPTPPREAPGLAGYLHILETARDARQACAGLGGGCEADLARSVARAEDGTPQRFLRPPGEAARAQREAEAAFQAAFTDCRARGVLPGTPRWDTCRMDRSIARLSEMAGLAE